MHKIYWSRLRLNNWHVYSARTEKGLCYIGSPGAPFEEMTTWVEKRFKSVQFIENESLFDLYKKELLDYVMGNRKEFTVPLDLYGTEFQQKVWQVLREIPYGEVVSYMDVAQCLQNPRAVRAVGGAIGANPVLIFVPCHRVITKDGKLGGFRAGVAMKEQLLSLEGSLGILGKGR